MNNPTKEQQLAISSIGNNFIVSAAAGSGKTSVLSARVLELVRQGAALEELLVLTFTNSAALSMKNKVRENLLKDKKYCHLAPRVDSSYIMTFDAFALAIVKKYHYRKNLSSSVSIVDESIINLVRKRFIDEIFESLYEKNDPVFISLISLYVI
jgi:ATP-dependent helicase/nuclease subunit A